MHPKFILMILTTCFSTIIFSQEIEIHKHLDDYNLNGKVKSIAESSYSINDETGQKNPLKRSGDNYFSYNAIWVGFNYKFNNHGYIVQKEFISKDGPNQSSLYFYEDGNVLSRNTYGSGRYIRVTKYKYYQSGLIKEVDIFQDNVSPIKSTRMKYNYADDGLISEILEEHDYELAYRHKYNHKDSQSYYWLSYNCNTYDGNERLTEKTIRQLNSKNKLIYLKEIQCYSNEESDDFKEVQIKYNKNGDIIEYIKYNSDDGISRKRLYKYKYDTHNNWIERITYINGYPKFIAEREYRYY